MLVLDLGRFNRGQSLRTVMLDHTTARIDASVHDPLDQTVSSNLITISHESVAAVRPVRLRYANWEGGLLDASGRKLWLSASSEAFTFVAIRSVELWFLVASR